MIDTDNKDAIRVVAELTAESGNYRRQFVIWLGVGSGAGVAALLTFAEKFDDPVSILYFLTPSLLGFTLGILCAGASVLLAGLRDGATAAHHASAHNRDEVANAIRVKPQIFSSSKQQDEDLNSSRNQLSKRHDKEHARAESDWARRVWWNRLYLAAVLLSASGFISGAAFPIVLIAQNSSSLHPQLPKAASPTKAHSP